MSQAVVQVSDRILKRYKGAVPTTAAAALTVAAGGKQINIVALHLANRGAATRDVSLAHIATGETYADDTYDVLNEEPIADEEFFRLESPHPDVPLFVLIEGDSLYWLSSGAGVYGELIYWENANPGAH
jgi:hypothetical protein